MAIRLLIDDSGSKVDEGGTQVATAGETMAEIVSSIGRVTSIMGEISSASEAQSLGVGQVGEAVSHMDQSTQQNAALVEQMAAAAGSLNAQANDLVRVVAAFRLQASDTAGHAFTRASAAPLVHASPAKAKTSFTKTALPKAPVAPAPLRKPELPSQPVKQLSQPAMASADNDDWETF